MTQDTEQEILDAYRAEVDRLNAIIAERDEQGRQRTAEGLRERNRADAAEAEAQRLRDMVSALRRDAGVSR